MKNNFWIKAKMVKGRGKGKKLGFPTINLKLAKTKYQFPNSPIPQFPNIGWGVYFCQVVFSGIVYKGVLYYGPRLTFKEKKPTLEIYLLNFNQKIKPGTEIKFKLLKYLREPKKFKNKNSLINQIREDVRRLKS